MAQENQAQVKILAVVFLLTFIAVEYVFQSRIDAIWPYALYLVEAFFCALTYFTLPYFDLLIKRKFTAMSSLVFLVLLSLGWLTHVFLVGVLKIEVPFDFHSGEVLWFLLLIGPILEEFVFRGVLISILKTLKLQDQWLALLSAFCFAYAHYQVVGNLQEGMHSFIYAQTVFSFVLGCFCAVIRLRRGLLFAILAHLLFNFGFWIYLYL